MKCGILSSVGCVPFIVLCGNVQCLCILLHTVRATCCLTVVVDRVVKNAVSTAVFHSLSMAKVVPGDPAAWV